MKLHLGGVVAGPAVIHTCFWQEKQSSSPSCTYSICPHETESSRSICPELPLRLSECNLCWQKASVGIRSLSLASSNAPQQYSESSRDSVQIVDAASAHTSERGREQTGLLGSGKAYSSIKICNRESNWILLCVRGRMGQAGESQVPWETCWLKEGRNEQQADTRAQADVCKDK